MVTKKEVKAILQNAIRFFGEKEQIAMCMEECAELIQACSKYLRDDSGGKNTEDSVVEEIADVEIMIKQVKIILNNNNKDKKCIAFKSVRIMKMQKLAKLKKYLHDVGAAD